MGWFDGNPTSLGTLEPSDEANKFIELLGGTDALVNAIKKAHSAGELQWALQLVDRLVYSGKETDKANAMKAAILKDHAEAQINCCARHYYLQCAKELSDTNS
jgi:uncharacterized sulfatase